MSYTKQVWEDLPSLNTPITAARLNHMEDGIAEAWEHGGSGVGETLRIGTILPYTGNSSNLPTGYMLCDGAELSRTEYSELFNIIGTSFGAGDGSTTFNLPDLKGRVLTGLDESDTDFDTLGEIGGEKTHTLTTTEMPSHYHTAGKYDALGINHASVVTGSGATSLVASGSTTSTHVITNNSGGDQPHNNLQPYVVVNYIIKVMETTPVAAQIVGGYTESDSDGYSTNYINTLQAYSSVETRVGTWIDNKPIYRKVLSGTLPTGSGNNTFTISNGEVISINGFVKSSYGIWLNTNSYYTEAGYIINCYLNNARNTITLECGSFYNTSSQYFIVVEYTKTTD